jgi:Holliday junction resolvase RusA-like endonuclease
MTTIRIVVAGTPIGKGRPRVVRRKNAPFPVAITPERTANYEALLAFYGAQAMRGRAPLDGPLSLRMTAYMPTAPSWSRKKTAAALAGSIRPGKPDLDNILKMIDALNNIVWRDDAQIVEAHLSKRYDLRPRLEIEVSAVALEAAEPASESAA